MRVISLREQLCPVKSSLDAILAPKTVQDTLSEQCVTALIASLRAQTMMNVHQNDLLYKLASDEDDEEGTDTAIALVDDDDSPPDANRFTLLAVLVGHADFLVREVEAYELVDPDDAVIDIATALWGGAAAPGLAPVLVMLNSHAWLVLPDDVHVGLTDQGTDDHLDGATAVVSVQVS